MSQSPESNEATGTANTRAGFQPKPDLVRALLDMGISRSAAEKALYHTGNCSAEHAISWVFDNEGKESLNEPLQTEDTSDDDELVGGDFLEPSDFYKMVFAVNMELKMGVGKVAAQVGHGAIGLFKKMCDQEARFAEALMLWDQFGETKVVLKADNAMQLEDLQAKAESLNLPTYLVQDAGRTQIAAGSTTVLAIMGRCDTVDTVTGKLSLL